MHGGGADDAAALLCNVVTQIGRSVAEGGVAGELCLADRQHAIADSGPVHVTRRHPARLQEGGHDQNSVVAAAGVLLSGSAEGIDLRKEVAAQRRVTSAHDLDRTIKLVADGE